RQHRCRSSAIGRCSTRDLPQRAREYFYSAVNLELGWNLVSRRCSSEAGMWRRLRDVTMRKSQALLRLSCLLVATAVATLIWYFTPAPPTGITIATAYPGTSIHYWGKFYKEQLASSGLQVTLKETNGSLETLQLLQDKSSGAQVGFVVSGVSD